MMKVLAPLLVVLLTALTLAPPLRAQSLAALAEKAADERAAKGADTTTPPTKVYTNKNVDPPPPPNVAEPIAPGTATPPSSPTRLNTTTDSKRVLKDEKYWQARMRPLQSTLAGDQAHLRGSMRLYDSVAATAHNDIGYSKMVDAAAEMTRWSAVVDHDKRAIIELEEEARQANVPPGWLRIPRT
jgi:hypothetical protein